MSATFATVQEARQRRLAAVVAAYPPEDYEFQIGNALAEQDGQAPRYVIVSDYRDGDHWLSLTDTPAALLTDLADGYDDHGWQPRLVFDLDDGQACAVDFRHVATIGRRAPASDV